MFAARTEAVITAHDPATPLFLYMPFQAVHCPIEVPAHYAEPYAALDQSRRQFAGMLAALDAAVGRVRASLEARGMWKDTLLFFTTDNGGIRAGAGALEGEGSPRVPP